MSDRLSASCHCGKIRLTVPKPAVGVLACHCSDCRKMHGNFNAFLAADRADVVIEGEDELVWYQSSPDARRAFCSTCGSRILKEVTPKARWLLSAGLLDEPSGKHIVRNLFEASKPDWYELPTATP